MRLLMTADAVGGVWTYALDLATGLARRGVQTTLAVLGPAPANAPSLSGVRVVQTGLPLDWTAENPADLRKAAEGVARLARETGADLIHLNSPALAGEADFPAPVVGGCHSCLATWWAAVRGGEPPPDFGWRIAATAKGYGACDALIAPSAAFAEATRVAYGVRPRVVHNGRPAHAATGARSRDGVLTAGRLWDEGKDAATLDAMAAGLDTPVLALGPVLGPQGQAVRFRHVRSVGRVTAREVAARLDGTRVFVSTAVYEPFGLSVLEAAQAGCALVLSDIEGFRELWDGAALFMPPRDAAAFASAVRRLLDDDAEAGRLAAAAQARARHYGVDAMVDATADLYRGLLTPAAGRAEAMA